MKKETAKQASASKETANKKTSKTGAAKKTGAKPALRLIGYDPLLKPYERDLTLRMAGYEAKRAQLLPDGLSLPDFANGHLFYGFHRTAEGWVYREWAPNARSLFLFGDFNNWDRSSHPMEYIGNGNFELVLQGQEALRHGSQVKVLIHTQEETFDRIPLYIRRAVQQPDNSFNGEIWAPEEAFPWTDLAFRKKRKRSSKEAWFIYECHVGIAGEQGRVSSFRDFTAQVLPRIARAGYNAIQLMAVMEHPYYGSFGYQVTNFFAVSSRFGTPDDLKALIDAAHSMGIAVFLDLVHSHAAPNALEGIGRFDGTAYQFFHAGARGDHPVWGTKQFNYGKQEVIHFLLSNLKFWLEEYHFDGFRFDGITSMLYHNCGLDAFDDYQKYFSMNTDTEAVTYLQLASALCKEVYPACVLIAEDMSGMPGMCLPLADGGIGFDYRLAMGMPDYWIKTLRTKRDEEWDLGQLWYELTQRRPREKVIGYCESHDQALVGDKTIMFWLADQEMYWHMAIGEQSHVIDRAMALHKMIRLITCACAGEGYLNFMGNEFGHPEWIDFPRESNGYSYHYARRQWSLADDASLRYRYLLDFDRAMIALMKDNRVLSHPTKLLLHDEAAKILIFTKGEFLFAFNYHTANAYEAGLDADHAGAGGTGKPGSANQPGGTGGPPRWEAVLHTDWAMFGGTRADGSGSLTYETAAKGARLRLRTHIGARSAAVYRLTTHDTE